MADKVVFSCVENDPLKTEYRITKLEDGRFNFEHRITNPTCSMANQWYLIDYGLLRDMFIVQELCRKLFGDK